MVRVRDWVLAIAFLQESNDLTLSARKIGEIVESLLTINLGLLVVAFLNRTVRLREEHAQNQFGTNLDARRIEILQVAADETLASLQWLERVLHSEVNLFLPLGLDQSYAASSTILRIIGVADGAPVELLSRRKVVLIALVQLRDLSVVVEHASALVVIVLRVRGDPVVCRRENCIDLAILLFGKR